MSKTLILIPSRMAALRLPGKPLLEVNNLPIISHVVKRGQETKLGEVIVCAEDKEIVSAVEKNGGKAVLTGKHHKTGTDRIFEGFRKLNMKGIDYIMSIQGDEPTINPQDIINLNKLMNNNNLDIGTLGAEIKEDSVLNNKNVVKVTTGEKLENNNFPKALNFTRDVLSKDNSNIYHHIGIYCYKVSVLEKFISLNQTKNEIENRLEQLRALDNNIEINVALAKLSPIGVDTWDDYKNLIKLWNKKKL